MHDTHIEEAIQYAMDKGEMSRESAIEFILWMTKSNVNELNTKTEEERNIVKKYLEGKAIYRCMIAIQ